MEQGIPPAVWGSPSPAQVSAALGGAPRGVWTPQVQLWGRLGGSLAAFLGAFQAKICTGAPGERAAGAQCGTAGQIPRVELVRTGQTGAVGAECVVPAHRAVPVDAPPRSLASSGC